MDAKTFFTDKLPKQLEASPDKAKEIGAIYAFNVTGDGGGSWTANLKDAIGVVEGATADAECTIDIANEDFEKVLDDPNAGMQLFFEGKLKVDGDPMLATKLQEIFKI